MEQTETLPIYVTFVYLGQFVGLLKMGPGTVSFDLSGS